MASTPPIVEVIRKTGLLEAGSNLDKLCLVWNVTRVQVQALFSGRWVPTRAQTAVVAGTLAADPLVQECAENVPVKVRKQYFRAKTDMTDGVWFRHVEDAIEGVLTETVICANGSPQTQTKPVPDTLVGRVTDHLRSQMKEACTHSTPLRFTNGDKKDMAIFLSGHLPHLGGSLFRVEDVAGEAHVHVDKLSRRIHRDLERTLIHTLVPDNHRPCECMSKQIHKDMDDIRSEMNGVFSEFLAFLQRPLSSHWFNDQGEPIAVAKPNEVDVELSLHHFPRVLCGLVAQYLAPDGLIHVVERRRFKGNSAVPRYFSCPFCWDAYKKDGHAPKKNAKRVVHESPVEGSLQVFPLSCCPLRFPRFQVHTSAEMLRAPTAPAPPGPLDRHLKRKRPSSDGL